MRRSNRFGVMMAVASIIALLPLAAGSAAASAQPRDEAGGVVKVKLAGSTATFLSITQESGWDVFQNEPSCLRPLKGQTEIDFDLNYRSTSLNAPVPAVTVSIQSANHVPLGVAVSGTRCRQLSNYRFGAATSGSQQVRGAAVFLDNPDTLGALRLKVDGHNVRLKLRKGCDALEPAQSTACSPFPVVRAKR